MTEYGVPAVGWRSTESSQSSGAPTAFPPSLTWKRSPSAAFPFGQDFVTVTTGGDLRAFVIVQVALSPKCASVPEQPAP